MQEFLASNVIVLFQLSRPKEFGFKVRRECMQNSLCMKIEEHGCQLAWDGEIGRLREQIVLSFKFFVRQNSRELMQTYLHRASAFIISAIICYFW